MFRFLHAADIHLDSPMSGLAARDGASVETILGASRKAFENLIDLAVGENVAFVALAGDIYDRDWKGYETGLFFRKGMVRLRQAGIRVFLISGNHDAASTITKHLDLPDNVSVFSSRSPETFLPEGLPVALHGMSFPNRAVQENLVPNYPDPLADKFNVGLLHTSLSGAEGHDTYAPCHLGELAAKGYSYWALGHIHQPGVLMEDPWVVYPGNIQGRSVRECGARGCRVVHVDDDLRVSECRWHELDVVRWAVAEIPVGDAATIGQAADLLRPALTALLEPAGERLLATRVILRGATTLHGAMQSHPDHVHAEIEARADEFGAGRVWIERVKIETSPAVSLQELAQRDALTKVIVETLQNPEEGFDSCEVLAELKNVLPPSLFARLSSEFEGAEKVRSIENACALILDRLTGKGGRS